MVCRCLYSDFVQEVERVSFGAAGVWGQALCCGNYSGRLQRTAVQKIDGPPPKKCQDSAAPREGLAGETQVPSTAEKRDDSAERVENVPMQAVVPHHGQECGDPPKALQGIPSNEAATGFVFEYQGECR